ncbi:hypothetical protein ACTTAF_05135 [Rhodobacter capsulatus]|uniref:hypothetical protein n=1 Tax=Rhodobacter capsulatus TaxID=1061 RepID=UPI0003D37FDB|nr:hypothetical protein [Rhodobacter capsulatus]ETD81817.1 hypothetical protein U703_14695 [Rhodobacter capsulatus YW1]
MHDGTTDPQFATTSQEMTAGTETAVSAEPAAPEEDWQHSQISVIWKGVETVMRHMIGLLDKIDAGVEGLRGVGTEQVGRALEDNALAVDRMRKQLREGIARLDQQLVVFSAQGIAQQQDLRRQMRALEAQVATLAAAQKAAAPGAPPAWVEDLLARIEERLATRTAAASQERIADLELQVAALQRQLSEAARRDVAPLGGAAQEIRLLLAELIAIQERDQKEGRGGAAQHVA